MGCDIHMYCEVKRKDSEHWQAAGRIFKNNWDRTEKEFVSIDDEGYSFGEPYTFHPYDDRNYDLFGILADVRNGTWGEQIKPISLPKGIPKDISSFVKKEYERWNGDGHSHSWLSLKELEEYNWHKKVKMSAYVSEKQAKEYKEKGIKPTCYSAWSSVGKVLEWEETIYQKDFCERVIPQLKKLEQFGEVRLVFWFDN